MKDVTKHGPKDAVYLTSKKQVKIGLFSKQHSHQQMQSAPIKFAFVRAYQVESRETELT